MGRSNRVGARAEALVAAYLRRRGYRILARNWRFHHKEVDLVARRGDLVVFVEVKARAAAGWGDPLQSITGAKRRDLLAAARGWIARHGQVGNRYRFDAATVIHGAGVTRLDYIEDAWRI